MGIKSSRAALLDPPKLIGAGEAFITVFTDVTNFGDILWNEIFQI